MKTLLVTARALTLTLGFGMNVAYADGGAGPTLFTGWEVELAQKANPTPKPVMPTGTTAVYGASQNSGTWLFTPRDGGGSNN